MTLLADDTDTAAATARTPGPPWVAVVAGAAGALSSLLLVVAAVLAIWSSDPLSPGTAGQAASFAAALWLGLGWAKVAIGGVVVGFVPLLLAALPLTTGVVSLRWVLRRVEPGGVGWVAGLLGRPALVALGQWWIGYAVIVAGAFGVTRALASSEGGASVVPWTVVGPALVVPVAVAAIALAGAARAQVDLLGPRLDGSVLPVWLRRAVGPALRGAGLLLAVGALLVAAAVAWSWDDVRAVQLAIGGGGGAATALWALQATSLPNLALWAVSFLAGPGFSVVDGASVTWSGAKTGLMPLIPVFAALPQPQHFPWFVALMGVVPVCCGGMTARWSLAVIARLSGLGTKALTSVSSALGAATVICGLDLLGGSSLGGYRLSAIGAPTGWLWVVLTAEMVIGALIVVLWDGWRLRR